MKERIKFALADIRYVQTEIEKILNRATTKGQRTDSPKAKKSPEQSLRSSLSKNSNLSGTPRKKQEVMARNTSPKRKTSQKINVQTFPGSPQLDKGIFMIQQEKEEPLRPIPSRVESKPSKIPEDHPQKKVMMMWKQRELERNQMESKPPNVPADSPQISARMMWKERDKEKTNVSPVKQKQIEKGGTTVKKEATGSQARKSKINLSLIKQDHKDSPIKPPKEDLRTPKMKKAYAQQVIVSGTITLPDKVDVPYHLQQKNPIPLRTDQKYLIQKYSYSEHEELKEKYKLLDERLLRLKKQFVPRTNPLEDEEEWEFKTKKKFALQSYNRYSPLTKLIKINDKLKRDEERSLSPQERKRRQEAVSDLDKPKWTH